MDVGFDPFTRRLISGVAGPQGPAGATPPNYFVIPVFAFGTAVTTGDGKAYWPVPMNCNAQNLVAIAVVLGEAPSTLNKPTVMLHNLTDAVDMLTVAVTVDTTEQTSLTADVAAEIDAAHDDVASGEMLRIDVDVAGTGTKGLWVILGFDTAPA